MADVVPTAIRFFDGIYTIFAVEAANLHIKQFITALKDLIRKTEHNKGHATAIKIYTSNNGNRETVLRKGIK